MTRSRLRVATLTVALLLGAAAPAASQARPDAPQRPDRSRLEERIRARMGEIIRERLGLTEAEEVRLSAIAREFEGRRRELAREERAARQEAGALVRAGGPDDEAAEALLDRFVTLRIREADLVREEQARLQEVLTPTQVLQLYELRAEIGRRIRAIRSRDGGGDGRRGRPGPGPGERSSPER